MTLIHTPRDDADLGELIAASTASGTGLSIAGGATKAAAGRPSEAAAAVSTARLSGISLYEPAELVLSAKAGTPLAQVEAALAAKGQMLPFEPADHRALFGTSGAPTVGAVAAANISGPRRISAGACRDALIGVRFVNGRGQSVKSGGRVTKNVTGLDLVKLTCGAWGTLGVFTDVTFKLLPRPESAASVIVHGLADARAIDALSAALGSPFEISGAAHLPAEGAQGARTIVRIEGFEPSVRYRLGEIAKLWRPFGEAEIIEGAPSDNLWRAVRDCAPLCEPREAAVWRISVAPSQAAALVARIGRALAERHFYDWGGGLIWLSADAAGDAGAALIRGAMRGLGGHATLLRAPAQVRAAIDVFEPLTPAVFKLTAGLKKSFDPAGILNHGRMYAGI